MALLRSVRVPVVTGTMSLALLAGPLAACGGGQHDTPASPAAPASSASSVADGLALLQADGTLPTLDRSASVSGPDADDNGVRDDIDALVAMRPDAPGLKSALLGMSRAVTGVSTVDTTDAEATRAAAASLNHAVACIWSRFPADAAGAAVAEMRKLTVNTKARHDAYMAYNRARHGAVVALPAEARCD